jgi:peptide/nickel transport system permease protein/oligopeptide transport system permease protein
MIFAVLLGWFPVAGRGGLDHLVLPAISLGLFSVAYNARMTRSAILEVLGQDYIRTAQAKGVSWRRVLTHHALRNALIPVVTVAGLQFGGLLGGAGVGRLTLQAIQGKDLPLVQASVTVLATIFVVLNLVIDLLYAALDPRVRPR